MKKRKCKKKNSLNDWHSRPKLRFDMNIFTHTYLFAIPMVEAVGPTVFGNRNKKKKGQIIANGTQILPKIFRNHSREELKQQQQIILSHMCRRSHLKTD